MADQQARQDKNQVTALLLHTGTAGTAETIRAIADSDGNLMVNLAAGEEINIGTLNLGTISLLKAGTIDTLKDGTVTVSGTVPVSGNIGGTISQMPYATYIDGTQTANVTYVGKAVAGAASTASVWQIMKIDTTGGSLGDTIITWADGDTNFNNLWSGRGTASYS